MEIKCRRRLPSGPTKSLSNIGEPAKGRGREKPASSDFAAAISQSVHLCNVPFCPSVLQSGATLQSALLIGIQSNCWIRIPVPLIQRAHELASSHTNPTFRCCIDFLRRRQGEQ